MTDRYDDVGVAPDPVRVEELRRRLLAHLAPRRADGLEAGRNPGDEIETEFIMLVRNDESPKRNDDTPTLRPLWRLGVVAASVVLIAGGIALVASTRPNDGAGASVATDESLATADAQEAAGIAQRFVEARDSWDGEMVRSLVADDAVIDDFAVATADDYLANSEFEQATGWRFMQPACSATEAGPPVEVSCTYTMENAWSRALGVGPFTGSSFTLLVDDGQIERVTHDFEIGEFSEQVFEVFFGWLIDAHPGDVDIIFAQTPSGDSVRRTTPEAITLVEQRTTEFVAALGETDNVVDIVSETLGCTVVPADVSTPVDGVPTPRRSFRCESPELVVLVYEYESVAALDEMIEATDYCLPHITVGPALVEAIDPGSGEHTTANGVGFLPESVHAALAPLGGVGGRC